MDTFTPRCVFPEFRSLPKSYFLGHHKAGLSKMKAMLSAIDLVIECRDYRIPVTSRNPLLEQSLVDKKRMIVYTKKDLGNGTGLPDSKRDNIIRQWHHPTKVHFSDFRDSRSVRSILRSAREHLTTIDKLTGSRMLIAGMPNVGKSSLLNALRTQGVNKGRAAQTGAQPGVTRKIGTAVKITEGIDGDGGVYLVDTPGVFVPYVPDSEAMLKLALCGMIKDSIISPVILADYLLFRINLWSPSVYEVFSPPTNDVSALLANLARKTGKLQKGGEPDIVASAFWLIHRWRGGELGKFVLDEITIDGLDREDRRQDSLGVSLSQARKLTKEHKRTTPNISTSI